MANVAEARSALHDVVRSGVATAVQRDAEALLAPGSEGLMKLLDAAVVEGIEVALAEVSEDYATRTLGAERYSRSAARVGSRSGHRTRSVVTPFGKLELRFVKTRTATLVPAWAENIGRFAAEVVHLGRELWVRGLSSRSVSKVADEALGGSASHTTVAGWVKDVADDVLHWLNRPLRKDIAYLVLDGIYVPILRDTSTKEPILVAVGITEKGEKEILDVLPAPSESTDHWSCLLSRLRARGLDVAALQLVITDGNEGVIQALARDLPRVPRQRCVVHKVRNIVGACPRQLKGTAPKLASAIWKAPNKAEARTRMKAFADTYRESHPRLTAIIEDDFEATLTFFDFDADRWRTLKSTNAEERINRELKRRFRDIGAMKGDQAASRHAVVVAMKLNADWEGSIVEGFKPHPRRRT